MNFYTRIITFCALLIGMSAQAQFTHPMLFEVNAPASIQGIYNYGPQANTGWGITALPASSVSGQLLWGYDITPDSLACDTITNNYSGKIVMLRRGVCGFSNKILFAQRAGAIGCVICNNQGGTAVQTMAAGTIGASVTIPAVCISEQDCALLAARLTAGNTIVATFRKPSISEAVGFYQYETPQNQIQTLDGINVDVMNTTSTAANNITTSVRIVNPYGVSVTLLDTIATLLPDSTTNSVFSGSYTPVDYGIYNMVFKSSLNNDSIVRTFKIGSNKFTQDEQANYTWLGVTDADFATANYRFDMGNVFLTGTNGGTAKRATFSLLNGDLYLGKIFQLQLYQIPTTATGAEQDYTTFPLVGVGVDTIDAADTADYTLITKPLYDVNTLLDSISLLPNRQYMLVVSHQGSSAVLQSPRFGYAGTQPLLSLGTTTFTTRLYMGGFTGNLHAVVRLETSQSACTLAASTSSTNPICSSGGSSTVATTGGGAPYTYLWNNGATAATATNLNTGSYTVTVTNTNGCSATATANVGAVSTLGINATISSIGTNCSGSNGSATVTPTNGTAPYTYLWNNAATAQSISNVAVGNYNVTITDANGCTGSQSVSVAYAGTVITASAPNVTSSACGSATGSASVSATNGTAPYIYLWSTGATDQAVSNIGAGTYSVTITDASGCTGVISNIIISNTNAPTAIVGNIVNNLCNGLSNGSATVVASGGTAPYSFNWSNNATTSAVSGLAAGVYNVSISDAGSCIGISSVTITQPTLIAVTNNSALSANVSCNTGSNGVAAVNVSGGTAGYTYNWSNAASTASISGLTAGSYSVTVTDTNGCVAAAFAVNVFEPTAIIVNAVTTNSSSASATDGSVSLTASGGTGSFTYIWSNGATTQNLNNAAAGTYSVTVTDGNGCTNVQSATVQFSSAVNMAVNNINVNIFPNPTENTATLNINLSKSSDLMIEIININGQVLSVLNDSNVLNNQYTLNTSEMPSGLYIIRIKAGSETAAYRLVKK